MSKITTKFKMGTALAVTLAILLLGLGGGIAVTQVGELGEGLEFVYLIAGDPANPFLAKCAKGWKEAAKALKVTATVNYGHGDISKSIDHMKSAIGRGVDGIYIFNLDPEGFHPYVKEAIEKGIAVATMSGKDPVYGPTKVPFVGFKLEEQGYTLGEYVAKRLEDGAHIAIFAEFIAPYSQKRRQGFLQAVEDAGIEYIASDTFEVGEEVANAVDTIKSYLLGHPETDAIIGMGSVTTPAGYLALDELEYKPGEVKWGGFDLNPQTLEGVKAGYGASNLDEVFNYGYLGLNALYLKAKYDFVVGDLPVATVMVDKANVKEYKYWVEQGIK